MDSLGVYFPGAHLDADKMSILAGAGHTIYGFDVVMPLFSVWHESAALGCPVDWGRKDLMPDCQTHIWKDDADISIPADLEKKEACVVPLKAIARLKRELGNSAAVCGKVFGPWTLGYHVFGVQEFLMNTLLEPDMIKRALEKLKAVTIRFALSQIEAGADCILLGDHATRDLCSPDSYREFLQEIHDELAQKIKCPLILHICGDTSDRIGMISQTRLSCFHWDTKVGSSAKARKLAGDRLSLMGGINNIEVLRSGDERSIITAAKQAAEAGIDVIAPECAVPLDTPMQNLKILGKTVAGLKGRWG